MKIIKEFIGDSNPQPLEVVDDIWWEIQNQVSGPTWNIIQLHVRAHIQMRIRESK